MPEAKEEKKVEKKKRKPVPALPSFEEFKKVYHTKGFMRICPLFCMYIRCPYFNECWGLSKAKEEGEKGEK